MNEIITVILAAIIYCVGYGLGFISGGIHRNKRKEELEKRFNRSVQNVIDNEMREQKGGNMDKLEVVLDEGAYMPVTAHAEDAGYDLFTPIDFKMISHSAAIIDTGVHMNIPVGYVGFLKSKSGLNVKNGITGTGVIDAGYTGSIVVKLYRDDESDEEKVFNRGDKIIQIVLLPICKPELIQVEELSTESERGDNGFGSTGN